MPNLFRYSPLFIGTGAFVWALGTDPGRISGDQLQREYQETQASIDLALAEIQLKGSEGTITLEAAQLQIDEWTRSNAAVLRAQAERAATLDRIAPLPKDADADRASAEDHGTLSPEQVRLRELESIQAQEIKSLSSQASSPEDFQNRVEVWSRSPAGAAILEEKDTLFRQVALTRPVGTQPIILQAPDLARPQEIEAMDFQENIARRIHAIRQRHPNATPQEMQAFFEEDKEYFQQNLAEIQVRLFSARRDALADKVKELKQLADPSNPTPSENSTIGR